MTLDAGPLIAAARNDRQLWSLHRLRLHRGIRWSIPTPALAQAWRGSHSARLSQLLHTCELVEMDERIAKLTGELCASTGTSDVVDAAVVVSARLSGEDVLTTDPEDLKVLAGHIGHVRIIALRRL